MSYEIVYLEDSYDCECCGGSWASGYQIYKDGELIIDKTPVAHCYSGISYEQESAPFEILKLEGINVEYRHDYIGEEDET